MTPGINSKSLSTLSHGLTSTLHALRHPPDVALVMNVANGFWIPLLRARGIPVLTNVDGIEWDRAKWGKLAKAIFRIGARLATRFSTRLVFDAEAIAQFWEHEFHADGAVIAYGGDEPKDTTLEPGLAHRGYALAVARFVPENTISEFIDAAALIAQKYDVVIVGSSGYGGVLDQRVAALAKANPRVHWLGHVADDRRLHGLWEHAGAYFHGHSVGGTNPALVQAMACGAPVVARDTVYTREVLAQTGRFVPPQATAIAAAITEILSDPILQQTMSQAAQIRAQAAYTWDRINAAYADELKAQAQQTRRDVQ
jgi:glycosyltransferase involved in cell wall biosynthesis